MNVASLDLCRELYELSGWRTDDEHPDANMSVDAPYAYDLGYLLRKLLPHFDTQIGFLYHTDDRVEILATFDNYGIYTEFEIQSNTPEDAACKLVIALFKQGILK